MEDYLRRRRIDFFLLPYVDRVPAVFDALEAGGEWAPVFYDEKSFVLLRRSQENEDLIAREAYRVIRPGGVSGPTTIDPSTAPRALEEAARAIRNCPESRFGHFYMCRTLAALGRHAEAAGACRDLLARDPDNATACADLGDALAALGRRDEAAAAYERAIRIRPDMPRAREGLRRLRGE
jgi:tetratricopeptide (TPR) repeat protein